ncbi:MAG: biotin/lipoyl-binding protein, partial [Desulfobacterales bacterium]|nr:biotin/lipoyl-binding protein [Desulfobacterales bacterium]
MNISKVRPRNTIIAGSIVLLIFFGGLGVWSYTFPMTGAVIAPGTVKVTQERKTVQHLEGGIIDKIYIKEGDSVQKGDLLIRLKSSRVDASLSLLQGYIWFKQAEAARLTAENNYADEITWPADLTAHTDNPEVQAAIQRETGIFTAKRQNLQGKIR